MSASHEVLISEGARSDLLEITDYITAASGTLRASQTLDSLMHCIQSLAHFPERGSHPPELAALGIKTYRQTLHKPWRIIYAIEARQVVIYLVADSRRHFGALLARRLLRG